MQYRYWRVHKNDIHLFVELGANSVQIKTWSSCCNRHNNNYVYINESPSYNLKYSYMPYDKDSVSYYKLGNYIYMGDFNLKRNRKEKLEKLNNELQL